MTWFDAGEFTTIGANGVQYWTTTFTNNLFLGPIAVAPNFGATAAPVFDQNFGKLTAGNVSIEADYGNNTGNFYRGTSFHYSYAITNESSWSLIYNIAIGMFQ